MHVFLNQFSADTLLFINHNLVSILARLVVLLMPHLFILFPYLCSDFFRASSFCNQKLLYWTVQESSLMLELIISNHLQLLLDKKSLRHEPYAPLLKSSVVDRTWWRRRHCVMGPLQHTRPPLHYRTEPQRLCRLLQVTPGGQVLLINSPSWVPTMFMLEAMRKGLHLPSLKYNT